jgi:hypothetical protein
VDLDLAVLLPHLAEVEIEQVEVMEDRVVIHAAPRAVSVNCPRCAVVTHRVHDRYVRRLTDVALGGPQGADQGAGPPVRLRERRVPHADVRRAGQRADQPVCQA